MSRMDRTRVWPTLAAVVTLLLLLLSGPALASAALVNAGMLILRDGLMKEDLDPSTYPLYEALDESPAAGRAMESFHRAVALDADNVSARWALGRSALTAGDAEAAANALGGLAKRARRHPLLYQDALVAFSHGGRPDEVIELYEMASPPEHTQAISDTVALAYLEQGSPSTGLRTSQEALEKALNLRPGDLRANYHLWKQAQEAGDMEAAAVYSETLAYFPLEAIDPTDERLLNYAAEVIPALLEEGLWDREKTLNVASFLVWQHHGAVGVEWLLEQLVERCPAEPDWPFYLAELYHRRGDLERAEAGYRQVLMVDPGYVRAYLRLGMVAEAKSQIPNPESQEHLEEAAGWYKRYNEMAPDDLLGLKKLMEVYEALGRPDAMALGEELEAKTDDRRIVAELLGVPVEDVELGPNLVENGEFETWEGVNPVGWRLGLYLGQDRNGGLYVTGEDALVAEGKAARIVTLWGGLMPDGTMTYAEYVGKSFPAADTKYLVSVYYRSWRFAEGSGFVFLGDYTHSQGLVRASHSLPDSNGQLWVARVLVDGPAVATSVIPLVRDWGVGHLEVGALTIKSIVIYPEGLH